jgi:hypothetical protein
MPKQKMISIALLVSTLIIFSIALSQPAFEAVNKEEQTTLFTGIACVLFGWLMIGEYACWSWFANLFFFGSLVKLSSKVSISLAGSAVILSLLSFYIHEVPKNEAGTLVAVELASGFYIWLSSFVLNLIRVVYLAVAPNITVEDQT